MRLLRVAAAASVTHLTSAFLLQQHKQLCRPWAPNRLRCTRAMAGHFQLPTGVHAERVQKLNRLQVEDRVATDRGRVVVYWMQRSARVELNHALAYASAYSNHLQLPLVVVFSLTTNYPKANERSYAFLLEGLSEVHDLLQRKGVKMLVRKAEPDIPEAVLDTCKQLNAALLVTDLAYDRTPRDWRRRVTQGATIPVHQVESDVVVPVKVVSEKGLQSPPAFRKRVNGHMPKYLKPLPEVTPQKPSVNLEIPAELQAELIDVTDPYRVLDSMHTIDRSVPRVSFKRGGPSQAKAFLARFLRDRLKGYHTQRKEAYKRYASFMSAYLHFGHISPVYIALKVSQHSGSSADDRRRFLDELVTWRELAVNNVWYNEDGYDKYESAVPAWARQTLEDHKNDQRPAVYTLQELEDGRTSDPYWNAAQLEARATGYTQNYMRMWVINAMMYVGSHARVGDQRRTLIVPEYWCKQMILWINDPKEAFEFAVYLNDKYFLDGRNPNGWMGVAWCFGRFDKPMPRQPVFGKVRSMSSRGLKSKQNIDAYVTQVQDLANRVQRGDADMGVAEATYSYSSSSGPITSSRGAASPLQTPERGPVKAARDKNVKGAAKGPLDDYLKSKKES